MTAQSITPIKDGAFDRVREQFMNELLDEREVEQEYGLRVGFLRAKRLHGGGPHYCKCGRSVRYVRRSVLEFIQANTVSHTTEADAR